MSRSTRPIVVVGIVFATVMGAVALSRWFTPSERIAWRDDFTSAQAEAKSTGRPMFVYFTADWCAPCHRLKATTWADERVERALDRYVPTRVDVTLQPELAMRYDAQFLPKYIVLDLEGNVVKSGEGYLDATNFLTWLRQTPR